MATDKPKTPEEIDAMEREVAQYRQQQAAQAAKDQREKAQPLIDLVQSDGFKALRDALPAIDQLATDTASYPFLRPHLEAIRNGMFGLQQTVDALPQEPVPVPASQQIVDQSAAS